MNVLVPLMIYSGVIAFMFYHLLFEYLKENKRELYESVIDTDRISWGPLGIHSLNLTKGFPYLYFFQDAQDDGRSIIYKNLWRFFVTLFITSFLLLILTSTLK